MTTVVVHLGIGNMGAVANMLKKLGAPALTTDDPADIARAERIVLPGVGAFDAGMAALAKDGWLAALEDRVLGDGVPLLGVCLGMQLLASTSEEGVTPGLGWIPGTVTKLPVEDGIRVPHMGWNHVTPVRDHLLVADLPDDSRFYFAHSYAVGCDDPADVVATTVYGRTFASVVARGNIAGMQFHPEKSHRFGMHVLANFVRSQA